MSNPRERSAGRILERIRSNRPVVPDPSVPILIEDDLIVFPSGAYIASLPVELVDD